MKSDVLKIDTKNNYVQLSQKIPLGKGYCGACQCTYLCGHAQELHQFTEGCSLSRYHIIVKYIII